MLSCIREVRRARGLTLDEVARRCVPPTTAQTVGRLETGTRTLSTQWLERLADALDVTPADLLRLPERPDLPIVAVLRSDGAEAPAASMTLLAPAPAPGMLGVRVESTTGDYRPRDELWCERLSPAQFHRALNRDVLAPLSAGRFAFGRLTGTDGGALALLPPVPGAPPVALAEVPWLALPVRLLRPL